LQRLHVYCIESIRKGECSTSFFHTMLYSLISLMVCLAAGFIGRKARILNDGAITVFTDVLINISLPCTVLITMIRPFSAELFLYSMFVLGAFTAVQFLGWLFGFIITKLLRADPDEKRVWIFAVMFSNVGYMGYPVINAVLGESALIYASMVNMSFNILAFSLGIRLIDSRRADAKYNWRAVFITPVMIATVTGLICFIASVSLPDPITEGVRYIAGMTTPLSMLLLGAILGRSDFRGLFAGRKVYIVLLVKHFALPLTVLAILKPFIHNHTALSVIVLLCAMPAASVTAIFAQKYNSGADQAARIVFISTVLSLITVPVISLFL